MRFGLCVPLDRFTLARDALYDYVEFPGFQLAQLTRDEAGSLAEKMKDAGISCLRVNAYCAGKPAIVGPDCDDAETLRYARRLFENAALVGAQCVGIGAPAARRLPEGYDRKKADDECARFLTLTAGVAAEHGITLLLEAVQHEMCNYLCATSDALAMVERLDLPNLALVVDLYHMEKEGEALSDLGRYLPRTRHLHVSTVEPGLRRRLYDEASEDQLLRAAGAIRASGYDGTVSAEPDFAEITPEAARAHLERFKRALDRA